MELPQGRYRVRWRGRVLSSTGEIAFDVTGRNGEEKLGAQQIPSTSPDAEDQELVRLDITLARTTPGIELRVFSRGGGKVLLREVVLEKD